jgi:hypothetical protein
VCECVLATKGKTHLLDVVVAERASILQLLAGEDQALLVWWDALLVLDLGLDVVDCVARLHLEGDGLARQGLHEDLHWTSVRTYFLDSLSILISRNLLFATS